MTRTFGLVLVSALLVAGTQTVSAEKPPEPGCKDSAARQFDFWVGHWRVTEHGKPAGENRIERILDGCALLENWTGAQGGAGKSLNFFVVQCTFRPGSRPGGILRWPRGYRQRCVQRLGNAR